MPQQTLADRIKLLRTEARELQADTAAVIGVSRSHLANIEVGKDVPGREMLIALARHYGVSVDWLMTGEGNRISAMTDRETRLLEAFRRIPPAEADAMLAMIEARARSAG